MANHPPHCLALNVDSVASQQNNITEKKSENTWQPTTAIFLELLGKGWYSLNLDIRRNISYSVSIGAVLGEGFLPNIMYYRFIGRRFRVETGGGFSAVITGKEMSGVCIHGVAGYRYQVKNRLFFRAGITPFLGIPLNEKGRLMFVPFPGISIGYSF